MRKQHIISREGDATTESKPNSPLQGDSILKAYTKQLMSSGRTDKEIVGDLEAYYYNLCNNCDQEILRLREELEIA